MRLDWWLATLPKSTGYTRHDFACLHPVVDEQDIESDGPAVDEALMAFVASFTARHAKLIGGVLLISLILGLGFGLASPRAYKQSAIIALGQTAREGPIEAADVVAQRVMRWVDDRVQSGAMRKGIKLSASPMLGRPPLLEPSPLLQIEVTGRDPAETREALEAVGNLIVQEQLPLIKEERARMESLARVLEESVSVLDWSTPRSSSVLVYLETISESFTVRRAAVSATTDPEIVAVLEPQSESWSRALGLPVSLSAVIGLIFGYLAAFARVARASILDSSSKSLRDA